jgi:hypothetical protein
MKPGARILEADELVAKGMFAIFLLLYLDLLDWIGSQLRGDKQGTIPRG